MGIFNFFRKQKKNEENPSLHVYRIQSKISDLVTSLGNAQTDEDRERIHGEIESLRKNLESLEGKRENEGAYPIRKEDVSDIISPETISNINRGVKENGPRMLKLFIDRFNFDIPESNYPAFESTGENRSYYAPFKNKIHFAPHRSTSWFTWGEEMTHFIRDQLNPEKEIVKQEALTDEFFGFLGRKLFFEFKDKKEFQFQFLFKKTKEEGTAITSRTEAVNDLTLIKKQTQLFEEAIEPLEEGSEEFEKIRTDARPFWKERRSILVHNGPYHFADKLDLAKITNWKKLFSMPNHEVRMRFFRPDPDYSGL